MGRITWPSESSAGLISEQRLRELKPLFGFNIAKKAPWAPVIMLRSSSVSASASIAEASRLGNCSWSPWRILPGPAFLPMVTAEAAAAGPGTHMQMWGHGCPLFRLGPGSPPCPTLRQAKFALSWCWSPCLGLAPGCAARDHSPAPSPPLNSKQGSSAAQPQQGTA